MGMFESIAALFLGIALLACIFLLLFLIYSVWRAAKLLTAMWKMIQTGKCMDKKELEQFSSECLTQPPGSFAAIFCLPPGRDRRKLAWRAVLNMAMLSLESIFRKHMDKTGYLLVDLKLYELKKEWRKRSVSFQWNQCDTGLFFCSLPSRVTEWDIVRMLHYLHTIASGRPEKGPEPGSVISLQIQEGFQLEITFAADDSPGEFYRVIMDSRHCFGRINDDCKLHDLSCKVVYRSVPSESNETKIVCELCGEPDISNEFILETPYYRELQKVKGIGNENFNVLYIRPCLSGEERAAVIEAECDRRSEHGGSEKGDSFLCGLS